MPGLPLGAVVLLCGAEALNLPFRRQTPPLPPVPALFTESDARPIVLFDGECNLCNAGVNLLLDRDRSNLDERGNLRVAAVGLYIHAQGRDLEELVAEAGDDRAVFDADLERGDAGRL